jgi:hypothetical protein
MKQEKTIYKGYFTYQANIIGYATYVLNHGEEKRKKD